MDMSKVIGFLVENREVIELLFVALFATSSGIKDVIATVSEMLQSASVTDNEVAKRKAIALLRRKAPFLAPVPDFILASMIEWFFSQIKIKSNKELTKINEWKLNT